MRTVHFELDNQGCWRVVRGLAKVLSSVGHCHVGYPQVPVLGKDILLMINSPGIKPCENMKIVYFLCSEWIGRWEGGEGLILVLADYKI